MIMTFCCNTMDADSHYATVILMNSCDIKEENEEICWFERKVKAGAKFSLWNCPFWPLCEDPSESVQETMRLLLDKDAKTTKALISLHDAVKNCNIEKTLERRFRLMKGS